MAIAVLSGGAAFGEHCPVSGERPGMYSRLATTLCFQNLDKGKRHLEIWSPDKSSVMIVDGNTGRILRKGKQIGPSFDIGPREIDVLWSPDGLEMITTISFGGLGPVASGVGYIDGPNIPGVMKPIQKDFSLRHPDGLCTAAPNVGALTWEGTNRAIFVAEVPSSSSCGDLMGYFEAYELSIPDGRILARYSYRETVKRWQKVLSPAMLEKREDPLVH